MAQDNKQKGLIITLFFHLGVIILLFIFGFSTPLPLPEEEAIVINFGTEDEGSGLIEPRPSQANESQEQVQEQNRQTEETEQNESTEQAEESYETQDFEDAASVENSEQQQSSQNQNQEKPQPKKDNWWKNSDFSGVNPDGDNTGQGDGDKPGNQGDPRGGLGNGVSYDLGGRGHVRVPQAEKGCGNSSGTVVVRIKVDRTGKVVEAIPGVPVTTATDDCLLEKARKAALRASFKASDEAAIRQQGTITYRFVNQ